ncbi:MAG TPA: hypothetical protein VK766_02365 [Cytophagaceae bacterium]|jgi:hypothetical protein|nr:hypothetical protein [Cytophagaceae bacterium]
MDRFFSKKNILIAAFIFSFSIVIIRIISVPLLNSGKARDSIHGDSYSDINTYSAMRYFYDFGFGKSYLLPVHGYKGDGNSANMGAYTHYPALPDILAGSYARILHTTDTRWVRIFPLLISIGFFFFIVHFFQTLLPDKNAAFIGALVLVLSNYFIFWADNLHKHLYEEILKWVYVYLLFLYYREDRKNKWLIVLCSLIFILVTNISFEPVTYLAIVTVGMSWIYKRNIFTFETILLGFAPVIGFGLHFYQNILYFGSVDLALADMTHAAALRTTGIESVQNEMKRNLTFLDYISIPYYWSFRIERLFLIPGPAFFFFAYLGLKEIRKVNQQLFGLGIVLLIASLSWNIFMTQHWLVHTFTTKHLGLFYGFVIGYGLLSYYDLVKKDWASNVVFKKILHVIFIGYILVMALSQQLFDYFRYGFFYSLYTPS